MNTIYHYTGIIAFWGFTISIGVGVVYFLLDYILSKLLKVCKLYQVFIEFIFDRARYKKLLKDLQNKED